MGDKIPVSYTENIFLILGIILGFFYGFDGWKSSTHNLKFQDSPRVKNFLWVILVAFGSFVSHLLPENSKIHQDQLLLFYLSGFSATAFIVVFSWGVILFVKFNYVRRKNPENYPNPPFNPISDYFMYGFAYHKEQYELKTNKLLDHKFYELQKFHNNFIRHYIQQLSRTMAATDSFLGSPFDKDHKETIIEQILNTICMIIKEFNPEIAISANFMLYYTNNDLPVELRSKVNFTTKKLENYNGFLVLRYYLDGNSSENFVLPVDLKNTLIGAPEAFKKQKYVVVDDTHKIRYPGYIDSTLQKDIRKYFREKQIKSFASLYVASSTPEIGGVLNIDSNSKSVFGESPEKKEELVQLISPFLILLGRIVYKNN